MTQTQESDKLVDDGSVKKINFYNLKNNEKRFMFKIYYG